MSDQARVDTSNEAVAQIEGSLLGASGSRASAMLIALARERNALQARCDELERLAAAMAEQFCQCPLTKGAEKALTAFIEHQLKEKG